MLVSGRVYFYKNCLFQKTLELVVFGLPKLHWKTLNLRVQNLWQHFHTKIILKYEFPPRIIASSISFADFLLGNTCFVFSYFFFVSMKISRITGGESPRFHKEGNHYRKLPGTPNNPTSFFMVGHQLDDEPNLYMGNGWKSPKIYV